MAGERREWGMGIMSPYLHVPLSPVPLSPPYLLDPTFGHKEGVLTTLIDQAPDPVNVAL